MSLWMVIVLLGLAKLPVAALMLWIPFRDDRAMHLADGHDTDESDASEDEGGSMALPASPLDPHPRSPRPHSRSRGPHGSRPLPSPPRIRRPVAAAARAGGAPVRSRQR